MASIHIFKNTLLDSYFIHKCMIIKDRSSSIVSKINKLLLELWPFFILFYLLEKCFHNLFEKNELESYFIYGYANFDLRQHSQKLL